ncbi:MAG: hypothetical protein ACK57T_18540, partial [Dolichospermum sp.]
SCGGAFTVWGGGCGGGAIAFGILKGVRSLFLCVLCVWSGSLKKDVWEVGGGAIALSLCLCGSLKKECLGS